MPSIVQWGIKTRYLVILMSVLLAVGCGKRASDDDNPNQTEAVEPSEPAGVEKIGDSFGLPNAYSGELTDLSEETLEQVHVGIRKAYMVESVKLITTAELKSKLEDKEQVAEEIQDGKRFVALMDHRHVQFSDEVSGLMIIIERYLVKAEKVALDEK